MREMKMWILIKLKNNRDGEEEKEEEDMEEN